MILFLLIIVFLSIEYSMLTRIDSSNFDDIFGEINLKRFTNGQKPIQRDSFLQFAAEKRCQNRDQLFHTYRQIQLNNYHPEQWSKEEKLDRYFPYVSEVISFTPFDLMIPPDFYRSMFISVGFTTNQHENFSVRCILYGLKMTSISSDQQLFRLLSILIGCAILFLVCLIVSLVSDRYRTKLIEKYEEIRPMKNSDRKTIERFSSFPIRDDRTSSIHDFIQ